LIMTQTNNDTGYFTAQSCDLDAFTALIDQSLSKADVPHACEVQKNVPLYDMNHLRPAFSNPAARHAILGEWAQVLMSGAGVLVLKAAYTDTKVLDEATAVFETIIAQEKLNNTDSSDHFAASGANDRIWNSLQKLCLHAPDVFLRYFANTAIDAACEAWLGPNYQMTAQVNLVHPGGAAQLAHRDYHLGFQTTEDCAQYPAHVHSLSSALTLQGGIAHCDMSLESGPTKLLPFSQRYSAGYMAWRRDDFRALFEDRHIQLPLDKGDALFFNPALFHGAGANSTTDIHRMVNLLQVSSAFGRAMETIDRTAMCKALYPHALKAKGLDQAHMKAAIAATAEGYSFPTNLDRDPPKGGLAPQSQHDFFLQALADGISEQAFNAGLDQIAERQKP
jgi:ectoine hydroxylase-related dioxygenase (phytanoyl-CoA dioxygenase family)